MNFVSTRGEAPAVSLSAAIEAGLAPDGGLYVPAGLPRVADGALGDPRDVAVLARRLLAPFFEDDSLAVALPRICAQSFSFPLPLVESEGASPADSTSFLELFHGPTAAFKDVGARFLGHCFAELGGADRTVLVATSGDTGGAVAAALHGLTGIEVCILFPAGGVSPEQEHQLTCWSGNVRAFAVSATFDHCQALLKQAMAPGGGLGERRLTTANSINVARVLGQVVYYAKAAIEYVERRGVAPSVVVPTGNVGNSTAALWAKRMGLPIERVVLATNENRTVPDYFGTGRWEPRASVATLANAMDVGNPSNMERVLQLYPSLGELRKDVSVLAVSDGDIRATIRASAVGGGRILDPHTATAVHVRDALEVARPVVVATAHPAKFASVVEPLIDRAVPVPPSLARLLERPTSYQRIEPNLESLRSALDDPALGRTTGT